MGTNPPLDSRRLDDHPEHAKVNNTTTLGEHHALRSRFIVDPPVRSVFKDLHRFMTKRRTARRSGPSGHRAIEPKHDKTAVPTHRCRGVEAFSMMATGQSVG